uniref:Macro domain-containing protein n=1 Tax=Timema tahoe TaxID=61484 RepID=A0A7R9IHS5_9NEOP|nr:unnamed protein product [Timema tahoe]
MSLEEKRQFYKRERFTTLDQIATWEEFFEQSKSKLQKQCVDIASERGDPRGRENKRKEANNALGGTKVKLWEIIDSANNLYFKETGTARIKPVTIFFVGGAIIRVKLKTLAPLLVPIGIFSGTCVCETSRRVGPVDRQLAFPCISTGVYGYPQEAAANIALRTVRNYLEKNPGLIDRVVFCLFLPEDVIIYGNLLQIYFPVEENKPNL